MKFTDSGLGKLDDENVPTRSSLEGAKVRNWSQTRWKGWTDEVIHLRYCLHPESKDSWETAVSWDNRSMAFADLSDELCETRRPGTSSSRCTKD